MATVLIEIGCEELPASACREAEAQLPELCRRLLGVEPSRVLITPRRLAVLVDDVAERAPDEWIKGPPVAMKEKAAAGFAKRHGVAVEELEERDGFLGVESPGKPLAEVLPEHVDGIVRGLAFSKTMRWNGDGVRFPRPFAGRWRWSTRRRSSPRAPTGHRFASGSVEIADASSYVDTLRKADVEPDALERRKQIVDALDDLGGWVDPNGVLGEVVFLVEKPVVIEGPVRRALPAAAGPRRRDDDPASHPRISPRREPLRLRRERRRPGHRAGRGRERRRGPPRGRVVHVRARRQGRDRQPRRAAGRDHVLRGRGLVRGQDGAPGEARRGSRRRRRGARGGEAREGGPGVRARAGVHGARGPHRRRSTRGLPAIPRRSARRSTSSTCPTEPTPRSRRPRPGVSSRPRTRSTR